MNMNVRTREAAKRNSTKKLALEVKYISTQRSMSLCKCRPLKMLNLVKRTLQYARIQIRAHPVRRHLLG